MAKLTPLARAELWQQSRSLPENVKQTIEELKSNPAELERAFGTNLEFGTGGIRKEMGFGASLLNRYTIRMITEGLARSLKKRDPHKSLKVIISYDTRYSSFTFAEECACTLAAHGISSLLLKEPRPTPLLSFGCRFFQCDAGIMITASHNPKEYNGYKVYDEHGGQVVSPLDREIANEINQIVSPDEALTTNLASEKITWISTELDSAYLTALEQYHKNYSFTKHALSIAYTPLHGTGYYLLPQAFSRFGFSDVGIVTKQCTFDGSFSTVHVPNPEEKEALTLGKALMLHERSDILMATDPDADRLGASVLHDGIAHDLSGNQIAQILLYRILKNLQLQNKPFQNAYAVTTIVSTRMLEKICRHYGIACQYVLTGFKYIAHQIEQQPSLKFLFGAEESYGYLFGDFVRDKDAIGSAILLARIAAEIKSEGKTLLDELDELSSLFGVHLERSHSFTIPSQNESEGQSMQKWLDIALHQCKNFSDKPIEIRDLSTGVLGLPKAAGLWILFENQMELILRPSGTEPKIKLYILANSLPCSREKIPEIYQALSKRVERLLEILA